MTKLSRAERLQRMRDEEVLTFLRLLGGTSGRPRLTPRIRQLIEEDCAHDPAARAYWTAFKEGTRA